MAVPFYFGYICFMAAVRNIEVSKISDNKIKFFQRKILEWYTTHGRTFPWRKKGLTHYQYVIAEVLLQRTKAETIAKFYPNFLKEFPNWKALANANEKMIEKYLIPVGLYRQRSKRLMGLAQEMVRRNGKLPRGREDLESIDFIGQYIANAIELIIFNKQSPLLDVNMARLLERYFGARQSADIRYDPYLQKLSYKVVNHQKAKEINWAILDFASIICKSQKPICKSCQFNANCSYFKEVRNKLYLAGTINSKR